MGLALLGGYRAISRHDQDEKMWSGFEKLNKTVSCGNNKLTGVL